MESTQPAAPPSAQSAEAVTRARRLAPQAIRGLPRPFWWLWLGTLVNRAGTFIEPFFVLYLTGPRHVSVSTAGLVLTMWGVGSLLSQPIGGVLTDRFGRRWTLGASLAATSAALLALALARSLLLITLLVLVLGTVADMYRPASTAAVADLVAEPDRTRAYAVQFWAVNLGFSIASAAAGVLLHHGFGVLFLLDAATTLTFGLLALRYVPETRPEPATADEPVRALDPLRLLLRDRLLLVATLLVLAYGVLYVQVTIGLPLAIRAAGLPASDYGYVIALNGVVIVFGQPLSMALLARWPRRVTLPIGILGVGAGVAATGLCRTPLAFAVTVVVWTVGEIATAGSFQALIASLAPPDQRGRYAGALGLAWGASGLVAPLVGASVFAVSPTALWWACLGLGSIAAAGQFWLLGRIDGRARTDRPSTGADPAASLG